MSDHEKKSAHITPTVGRMVHFRLGNGETWAGVVCAVNADGTVNLSVFNPDGVQHGLKNVVLVQEGDAVPVGKYCEWMPYQKAVASGKAEAVKHK